MNEPQQRALIVGSNTGIGWLTAQVLAERAIAVRIPGRDAERLAPAAAGINGEVETFRASPAFLRRVFSQQGDGNAVSSAKD